MARAYSYIRFSRPEQMRGDSLRRQTENAEKWAAENGHTIDRTISDLGVSGYRGANRISGALGAFLELVHGGRIENGSILIVESLDRISREDVFEIMPAFLGIVRAGITIVTLIDRQVFTKARIKTDKTALLVALMTMMRANEESSTKATRVAEAWEKKRTSGLVLTSRVPAWLQVVTEDGRRKIIEIDARVRIVERIFRETVGGFGRRRIADRLNADPECRNPFGRGVKWQPSYIKKVLENRAVLGEMQSYRRDAEGNRVLAGEPTAGYYPAIIDEATFVLAQRAKASRANAAGRRGEGVANVLAGLARCGACNSRMKRVNKGNENPKAGKPYLVCADTRELACANDRKWKVDEVERLVVRSVSRIDLARYVLSDQEPRGPSAEELERARSDLDRRRSNLLGLVAEGEEGAIEMVRGIAAEIKALDRALSTVRADQVVDAAAPSSSQRRASLAELLARMETAEGEARSELRTRLAHELRAALQSVRFWKGEIGIVYPKGAQVEGRVYLPKPTYVPIFRDHADWKEGLEEGQMEKLDPKKVAADRAWLASLRRR